jgi:hypothetical protein
MNHVVDFPLLVFATSFIALWLSALIGSVVRRRLRPFNEDQRDAYGVVQTAALSLLGHGCRVRSSVERSPDFGPWATQP